MIAHWGTFNKGDSLERCSAIASAALADEGLNVNNTTADGPQFLLGSSPGVLASVFLYPLGPQNTRATVIAFSGDSPAAEGARNRVRQRIVENAFFQPTKTPWAVLLCKFNDNATEPNPRSFYEDLFTASGTGTHNMVDYFRDVSHRRLDISGSKVFGWYTLDKKKSDYTGSGANGAGRQELINWARQAATKARDDLSPYFGVVVCMNVPTDLFGDLGFPAMVCSSDSMEPSVIGQEMGHGYGLDHSRQDGSTTDYMDRWDTMSTWDSVYMASHSKYTLIGPILNAANMAGRGWLDEARVWTAASFVDTTVSLRPLVRYDLPGFLAARVGPYLVEFRVQGSWDAAIPASAVLVHRFEGNHSYIMSAVSGRQDLVKGSVFQIGNPAVLSVPSTRIEVVDIDASGYTATLRVTVHPGIHIPFPLAGPGSLFGGVAEDAGGSIVIGGTVVPIPPRSPAFGIITQLASLHASELLTNPTARASLRREALAAIKTHIEDDGGRTKQFSSPAQRNAAVEGRAQG